MRRFAQRSMETSLWLFRGSTTGRDEECGSAYLLDCSCGVLPSVQRCLQHGDIASVLVPAAEPGNPNGHHAFDLDLSRRADDGATNTFQFASDGITDHAFGPGLALIRPTTHDQTTGFDPSQWSKAKINIIA